MSEQVARRLVLDVTTTVRWTGPPVGIVRVERELALWASANVPDLKLAIFDPAQMAYCELKLDARPFIVGDFAIDMIGVPDLARPVRRKIDRAPVALRPLILWIGRFRHMLLGTLDAIRLAAGSPRLQRLAGRLQAPLISKKYRKILIRPDGTQRPFVPYRKVVGGRIDFTPGDTLICAGSGWAHSDIAAIGGLKSRTGFRFVLLCHDLIPLLFPRFYRAYDVDMFRGYMHQALALADLVVVTSRKTKMDCQAYCAEHVIALRKIAVSPLGFDVGIRDRHTEPLPNGLSQGRFALMVSTMEPRKGHRLLYNVWRRLAADGIIGNRGFKLVFVGRIGWMVDDLLRQIRTDPLISDQILLLGEIDDRELSDLYEAAAFCVYPSRYEGYGLPICEAFSHGKPVLASNAGALPELVQDLSPCLDPEDEDAWYKAVREWIEHPDLRVPFERAIRERFHHPTWSEAAANFFAISSVAADLRFTES